MSWTQIKESLTIAVDFDETFTADVDLWTSFILIAQSKGHKVVCITARKESFDSRRELETALPKNVDIYFAYDMAKLNYAEKYGIEVDIWIDDSPYMIVQPME